MLVAFPCRGLASTLAPHPVFGRSSLVLLRGGCWEGRGAWRLGVCMWLKSMRGPASLAAGTDTLALWTLRVDVELALNEV